MLCVWWASALPTELHPQLQVETGSLYAAQVGLEVHPPVSTSARIIGKYHHTMCLNHLVFAKVEETLITRQKLSHAYLNSETLDRQS